QGKSGEFTCKFARTRRGTVDGYSLVVPGRVEGQFEHVTFADKSRTTARHNSIGAPKPPCFSANWTTGCQFSIWRAVGGASPKTPNLPCSLHSAPFRVMARCGGACIRRMSRHVRASA